MNRILSLAPAPTMILFPASCGGSAAGSNLSGPALGNGAKYFC